MLPILESEVAAVASSSECQEALPSRTVFVPPRILLMKWMLHLSSISPDMATSKGWGSRCWKRWFEAIDMFDECDILVADNDDEDESNAQVRLDSREGYERAR